VVHSEASARLDDRALLSRWYASRTSCGFWVAAASATFAEPRIAGCRTGASCRRATASLGWSGSGSSLSSRSAVIPPRAARPSRVPLRVLDSALSVHRPGPRWVDLLAPTGSCSRGAGSGPGRGSAEVCSWRCSKLSAEVSCLAGSCRWRPSEMGAWVLSAMGSK